MDSDLFCFFVSGNKDRIFPDSELWKMPLSGKSNEFSNLSTTQQSSICNQSQNGNSITVGAVTAGAVTIGDYLSACKQFLTTDDFLHLKLGMNFILGKKLILGKTISTNQLKRIDLYLVKHGAFYHPVKVVVSTSMGLIATMVLNGAVSARGLAIIKKEYSILSNLSYKPGASYIPSVFGMDVFTNPKGDFGFILGEWFDGYKEFHITDTKKTNEVVVWSDDGTSTYISLDKSLPVYQGISKILTHYYNIDTFEQIFPWHHAAGDFVIKENENQLHVRLITIRDYVSLLEFESSSTMILPGLLMFFLNLSLRIRLDRLDGIGELVFLDQQVLDFTIQGFLQGLDEKTSNYDYGDIGKAFIEFIQQFDQIQIQEMIENLLESHFPDPIERQLIVSCLKSHSTRIYTTFQTL